MHNNYNPCKNVIAIFMYAEYYLHASTCLHAPMKDLAHLYANLSLQFSYKHHFTHMLFNMHLLTSYTACMLHACVYNQIAHDLIACHIK